MSREVVISAVGVDRPGIVAALTDALLAVRGNLSDCRAALLRGSFATVLAVSVPDDVDDDAIRAAIGATATELDLSIWIGPAAPAPPGSHRDRCVVSVYGVDHPGILSAITRALAERAVNILDLSSRIVGDPPLYVVAIEAELPTDLDAPSLAAALAPVAAAQAVEVSVTASEDEAL